MSDINSFLSHHGVKGMRWGVKRGESRLHNKRVKMFGEEEANRLYFDNISKRTYKKIQDDAIKDVKGTIQKIDKKPEYSDVNLLMNKHVMDKYYTEIDRAFEKSLDKSLVNVLGSDKSPSGKYSAQHYINPDTGAIGIRVLREKEVSHDIFSMLFDVETDENGHVISIMPSEDLMQTDINEIDSFLEHHGIKGMKWGVRKSRSSDVSDGPTPIHRRTARADKKFEKAVVSRKNRAAGRQLLVEAAKNANDEILELNKKYSRNEHQLVEGVPVGSKKYYDEVYSILNKHLDSLSGFHENASNTRRWKLSIEVDDRGVEHLRSRTEEVKHSSMEGWVDLPFTKDSNGLITSVEFPDELLDLLDETLKQDSMSDTEEFLEHHGIKGMKWGVRRKNPRRSFASEISKPADTDSEDGISTQKILAKQKKHGTVALTNHELRTINARQKLEQEFVKANPPPKNKLDKGHDQVKRYLAIGMTAKSAYDLLNSPAGKALRNKGKKYNTDPATKLVWQAAFAPLYGKPKP